MQLTLRRAGGSLVMTVPKAYIDQNHLHEGSKVDLMVEGERLTIQVARKPKYDLKTLLAEMPTQLLAEMPTQFPVVAGWDTLTPVGEELL
jgi:antitoxin ChpS